MILIFLKKYWRDILIILLVIVVLFSVQKCKQKERTIEVVTNINGGLFDSLTVYHVKYKKSKANENTLVTQVRTLTLSEGEAKKYASQVGIDNVRLIAQVGSLNNLVGYYKVKASVRDTFTVTNIDTVYNYKGTPVKAKYFNWTNNYLTLNEIHTDKETIVNYKYNPSFELIPYWKRKGILGLGKSQLVTDIRFDDPNARVQEMKAVVITPPKKRWYETKGAALGVGLIAGFFLAK